MNSGLSYGYILSHDSKKPHCAENASNQDRLNQIEYITYAPDYAEPRCRLNGDKGILFGNWNYFSRKAYDLLERAGYDLEWEDEWTICDDCGKAIRTQPDCYSWSKYYVIDDNGISCMDCLDKEEYLESIEDNPNTACMESINPKEYGYELIKGKFENGFHAGMNDNPKKIFQELKDKGYKRLIFRISDVSQFYITFEVWQKIDIDEELDNE